MKVSFEGSNFVVHKEKGETVSLKPTRKEKSKVDKFAEMKEAAKLELAILAECNVDNTRDGVHDALAKVLEHGSYGDGAKAIMIVSQWMWADCEERYHAQKTM